MNYEEMLENREGVATHREELPLGVFYKKLVDKKYRNVLELRPELTDSIIFCESIKADAKVVAGLKMEGQLQFVTKEDSSGIYELELEAGAYQSYQQLLTLNPAVVAGVNYVDKVIGHLASVLKGLHKNGIFQCCLAPQFIFARKNDNMPLLLFHGSLFKGKTCQPLLYKEVEDFVAPEVLEGNTPDERSDVYALGKFIELLHKDATLGMEYRKAVAKATQAAPEERYTTIDQMLEAIARQRNMLRSAFSFAAAVAIALLCVWLYFELMPETMDVEFVKPVEEEVVDPYEVNLTPAELGLDDNDTTLMTPAERAEVAEMEAEVERIFSKQFGKIAEQTFSKMYSKESMNASQQTFVSSNNSLMDDLLRKRDALAAQSGLSASKAEEIANQVIGRIRAEKQKQLKNYGFQKPTQDEE